MRYAPDDAELAPQRRRHPNADETLALFAPLDAPEPDTPDQREFARWRATVLGQHTMDLLRMRALDVLRTGRDSVSIQELVAYARSRKVALAPEFMGMVVRELQRAEPELRGSFGPRSA